MQGELRSVAGGPFDSWEGSMVKYGILLFGMDEICFVRNTAAPSVLVVDLCTKLRARGKRSPANHGRKNRQNFLAHKREDQNCRLACEYACEPFSPRSQKLALVLRHHKKRVGVTLLVLGGNFNL